MTASSTPSRLPAAPSNAGERIDAYARAGVSELALTPSGRSRSPISSISASAHQPREMRMSDAKLVGGSEADRKEAPAAARRLYRGERAFRLAAAGADLERIARGHVLQPQRPHLQRRRPLAPAVGVLPAERQRPYRTPFDIGGTITGDMAVIWCQRDTRRNWVGKDQPPRDIHYQGDKFVTRSTMVFHKEGGNWRVVHAHFSKRIAVRGRAASDGRMIHGLVAAHQERHGDGRLGRGPFKADVAVAGDRIVAVAPELPDNAERIIDATNLVVAPGFIDIHSHSDFFYEQCLSAESRSARASPPRWSMCSSPAPVTADSRHQVETSANALGATLKVRWRTFDQYLDALEQAHLDQHRAFRRPRADPLRRHGGEKRAPSRPSSTP